MRRTAQIAAFAAAALAGCAHRPPLPPVELRASGIDGGCRFQAEGRVLASGSLAQAETMLAEATRGWRGRRVLVLAGTDAPYKCFGLAMFVLQRAGADAGFISEPPPGRR
ncbi:MAG TPA: hypothetical protein VFQ67_14760 [Allosphingosinicella sp.]|jgi:hypothetical protein|nr:hypothetical protein [Allosphingosinicella sp.]